MPTPDRALSKTDWILPAPGQISSTPGPAFKKTDRTF
jgi:hypothetical protein